MLPNFIMIVVLAAASSRGQAAAEPNLAAVLVNLESNDEAVRDAAFRRIAQWKNDPALARALKELFLKESTRNWDRVQDILLTMQPGSIDDWIGLMDTGSDEQRLRSLRFLLKLAGDSDEKKTAIVKRGLDNPNGVVRRGVAHWIYHKYAPADSSHLPRLQEMIQSKDTDDVMAALYALPRYGDAAKPAFPFVDRIIRNKKSYPVEMRYAAIGAYLSLGESDQVIERVCAIAADPVEGIESRVAAASCLGGARDRKSAIRAILTLLKDLKLDGDTRERLSSDDATVGTLFYSLTRLKPGPEAVPALIKMLENLPDRNYLIHQYQQAILVTLAEIGPPAASAVPAMLDSLHHVELVGGKETAQYFERILGREATIQRLTQQRAVSSGIAASNLKQMIDSYE